MCPPGIEHEINLCLSARVARWEDLEKLILKGKGAQKWDIKDKNMGKVHLKSPTTFKY